jgi:hypothetical protein
LCNASLAKESLARSGYPKEQSEVYRDNSFSPDVRCGD